MQARVDGHRVYAYTGGVDFDGTLPVVVFLHGAQGDHSVWILQSRYFAHHGHAVLALDLPGHGRSEGAPLPTITWAPAVEIKKLSTSEPPLQPGGQLAARPGRAAR